LDRAHPPSQVCKLLLERLLSGELHKMAREFSGNRRVALVFWVLAVMALIAWALMPGYVVGWDLLVIRDAVLSIRAGHDPYHDAIVRQEAYRSLLAVNPRAQAPFSYVYAPITLPALWLAALLPFWLTGLLYWVVYVAAIAATIWFALRLVEDNERRLFAVLAPVSIFFPGLLQNDTIFSGNVAFILYGLVFMGAWQGWKHGRWIWFYAAVIVASFFKAPMLSLVLIAVFSARKQWLPSFVTGAIGVVLFAGQRLVRPELFRDYMKTLDYMFVLGKDFSSSPAGLLAQALFHTVPYRMTLVVGYVLYALPVACVLASLARRFYAGAFSVKQWGPLLILGVVLLNPRIIEYDVAPITLLMALVAWRVFSYKSTVRAAAVKSLVFFAVINVCAGMSPFFPAAWRLTECFVMLGLFGFGARQLMLTTREA
jgi:hypothetical protein